MTPATVECQICHQGYAIGDYPFCRPGRGHGRARSAIQTNEAFIGGLTIENLGHDPVTVYSRDEFKAAMAAAHVEQRIHHVPGDKYLTDWSAGIDAQTLENARILVSRGRGAEDRDEAALPSYRGEIRYLPRGL